MVTARDNIYGRRQLVDNHTRTRVVTVIIRCLVSSGRAAWDYDVGRRPLKTLHAPKTVVIRDAVTMARQTRRIFGACVHIFAVPFVRDEGDDWSKHS